MTEEDLKQYLKERQTFEVVAPEETIIKTVDHFNTLYVVTSRGVYKLDPFGQRLERLPFPK